MKKYKVLFHDCNANCIGLDSVSVKIIEVLPLKGRVVCYLGCPGPSQVLDRRGCPPRGRELALGFPPGREPGWR